MGGRNHSGRIKFRSAFFAAAISFMVYDRRVYWKIRKECPSTKSKKNELSNPENAKEFADRVVELVSKPTKKGDHMAEGFGCMDYLDNVLIEAVQKTSAE